MADNTILPGIGDNYAANDIGGVKYQRVKLSIGEPGVAVDCSSANPLPVTDNYSYENPLPVSSVESTELALDLSFINSSGITFLTADVSPGDRIINVANATGITVGGVLGLGSGAGAFYFGEVLAINTLAITVDTPVDGTFLSGSSSVIVAEKHMNVVGTPASPVIFQIGPIGPAINVHITRVMGHITDGTVMDDTKFGGGTALTNGLVFRLNNGVMSNFWNVKSNAEFRLLCFDANYAEKAGGGSYGFNFRNTYAGASKHGVALELLEGDTLEVLIQDDLSGLEDFIMLAQGHIVDG
jgi:hypothetical protein